MRGGGGARSKKKERRMRGGPTSALADIVSPMAMLTECVPDGAWTRTRAAPTVQVRRKTQRKAFAGARFAPAAGDQQCSLGAAERRMASFETSAFVEKLSTLTTAQASVELISQWHESSHHPALLHQYRLQSFLTHVSRNARRALWHRKHHKVVCDTWLAELRKAEPSRRVAFVNHKAAPHQAKREFLASTVQLNSTHPRQPI